MGSRAGPDERGKSHLLPGFDPQTAQPVASRYTLYANFKTWYKMLTKQDRQRKSNVTLSSDREEFTPPGRY